MMRLDRLEARGFESCRWACKTGHAMPRRLVIAMKPRHVASTKKQVQNELALKAVLKDVHKYAP